MVIKYPLWFIFHRGVYSPGGRLNSSVSSNYSVKISQYFITTVIQTTVFYFSCLLLNAKELDSRRKSTLSTQSVPRMNVSNCTCLCWLSGWIGGGKVGKIGLPIAVIVCCCGLVLRETGNESIYVSIQSVFPGWLRDWECLFNFSSLVHPSLWEQPDRLEDISYRECVTSVVIVRVWVASW